MKRKTTLYAILLALFIVAAQGRIYAQAPDWLWSVSAGYNSYDEAYTTAIDAHGNIWVAGYYNTYIFNLPLSKGPDAYIARFDPSGHLLWTGGICDTGAERITNLAFDKFGNYYLLGMFDGNGLDLCNAYFPNANPNAYDIFLAKFDSLNLCQWVRVAGGTDEDTPTGLAVDSLGNCYITGYFNSPSITFGAYPLTNSGGGNSDLFIAKYDTDGTALWARSATGTTGSIETSKSIAIDKQGDCYITGNFNCDSLAFGTVVIEKIQNINMYLAKYSASGNALWALPANCTGDSWGNAVIVDPDDNCYVAGSFKNSMHIGDTTISSGGYRDVFLAKYTADSGFLWVASAGGSADDEPYALTTDHLGYCYLTGSFKSSSISFGAWPLTNNSNAGFADIFVTEFQSGGQVVWAKSIGGLTNDNPNAIAVEPSRDFVIAASLGSTNIVIGDTTLYNAGTVDALIVKSANLPPAGIQQYYYDTRNPLFPNPAQDHFNVRVGATATLEILGLQGNNIKTLNPPEGEARIDISDLPAGMYFVVIRDSYSLRSCKLIKI
jgi:hypothetical protein